MSQVNAEGAGARLWRAVKRFPFILVTTFVVGCLVGWWVIAPAMAAEQGVPGIEMVEVPDALEALMPEMSGSSMSVHFPDATGFWGMLAHHFDRFIYLLTAFALLLALVGILVKWGRVLVAPNLDEANAIVSRAFKTLTNPKMTKITEAEGRLAAGILISSSLRFVAILTLSAWLAIEL